MQLAVKGGSIICRRGVGLGDFPKDLKEKPDLLCPKQRSGIVELSQGMQMPPAIFQTLGGKLCKEDALRGMPAKKDRI